MHLQQSSKSKELGEESIIKSEEKKVQSIDISMTEERFVVTEFETFTTLIEVAVKL